jgi:FkbM family methyltransferase
MIAQVLEHPFVRNRPLVKKSIIYSKLFIDHKLGLLKKAIYGRNVRAILVNSRNGNLLIDVEDQTIGRCLLSHGEYSMHEIEQIQSALSVESDLLVVGAHIGTYVIPLAKHCRHVVAVEANPLTFELLKLNLLINGATNVCAIATAASDKSEDLDFILSRTNSGSSKRMPARFVYDDFSDSPEVTKIHACRLDDRLPNSQFEVIVMDIEGSEYFAFRGMQRILAGAAALFVEFLPHYLKDVSNVTVAEFIAPIYSHFSWLSVPGSDPVSRDGFLPTLQRMYEKNVVADSIVFSKRREYCHESKLG